MSVRLHALDAYYGITPNITAVGRAFADAADVFSRLTAFDASIAVANGGVRRCTNAAAHQAGSSRVVVVAFAGRRFGTPRHCVRCCRDVAALAYTLYAPAACLYVMPSDTRGCVVPDGWLLSVTLLC